MRGATSIIGNIPIALSRIHELHCKVCSPNFYDFKFLMTFSPISSLSSICFHQPQTLLKMSMTTF